jgi:hypothetical protein
MMIESVKRDEWPVGDGKLKKACAAVERRNGWLQEERL